MQIRNLISLLCLTGFTVCAQNAPPAAPAPAAPVAPAAVPQQGTLAPVQGQNPNLPPAMQRRQLPPGLQQRPLPPGMQRQLQHDQRSAPQASAGATNAASPQVPRYGSDNSNGGTNQVTRFNDHDRDDYPAGNTNQVLASTNSLGAYTNQLGSAATNRSPWGIAPHVVPDEAMTPQDRELAAQIRRSLLPEIRRDRIPIHLVCQNGVVTITGLVPSQEESTEIAGMVQRTPGVVRVVNQLTIGDIAESTVRQDRSFNDHDRDLLGHVRGQFQKHHVGGQPSESVHIVSRDGVITLYGFVASQAEEQQLVAAAQSTPGVVRVDDRLRIGAAPDQDRDRDRDHDSRFGGGNGTTNIIGSSTNVIGSSTNVIGSSTNVIGTSTNQVGGSGSPGGSATGTGSAPPTQPGTTNGPSTTNTPGAGTSSSP